MSTQTIDVTQSNLRLAELLALLEKGSEIVLTKNKTPLAKLTSVIQLSPRVAGIHQGAMVMADNFDAPLPDTL